MVILPPFWYGAASYAVEGPEGKGSVHVDAGRIAPLAEEMFTGLLRIGFRNIHGFIHHQSENFAAGMPTDLAFRFGARQAIFRFLEKERGEGWWGDAKMVDYYSKQASGADPFNWIKIHPLMSAEVIADYPFDHAGIGETSLMLSLCPEAVEMGRTTENTAWYTASAVEASAELGNRARELIRKYEWTFEGARGARLAREGVYKFNAIVTSFNVLNADWEHLSAVRWRYVIVDEAHALKNIKGQLQAALQQVAEVHQHGGAQATLTQALHHFHQVDLGAGHLARAHHNVALGVGVEEAGVVAEVLRDLVGAGVGAVHRSVRWRGGARKGRVGVHHRHPGEKVQSSWRQGRANGTVAGRSVRWPQRHG
jgi:creatinine amidohydrolase